jgi:small-conductance mechanosensitive channel
LIITPIVIALLAYLLKVILLRIIYYFEIRAHVRTIWRRVLLYFVISIAIFSLFIVWEARAGWLAENLSPFIGKNASEILPYIIGLLYAEISTLILVLILYMVQKSYRFTVNKLKILAEQKEISRIQKLLLLNSSRMQKIAVIVVRVLRFIIILLLFYFYIPLMLSFFPATASLADKVMPYVTGPTLKILQAFLDYIPNLITLILIVISIKYLLRFLGHFFTAISKNEIRIKGFDPDWADQTFRLTRVVIVLLGIILSYPYLPGSGSDIFKGFSLFIGALITLGSTSAVNNIVSGIVLTYTGAFRIGDRVKIGDTLGDVIEKKLFVTRLKTFKNEYVTFPNGQVLGASIINLSKAASTEGVLIEISAGIGYDVDWRKVHELMKAAASQTSGILDKPEPFVLQRDLGDFAVTYTLNVRTNEPKKAIMIESELRQNLLDTFNKAGIEIMSPSVTSIRDANVPLIPPKYNPKPFSIGELSNTK